VQQRLMCLTSQRELHTILLLTFLAGPWVGNDSFVTLCNARVEIRLAVRGAQLLPISGAAVKACFYIHIADAAAAAACCCCRGLAAAFCSN
jgi:hypothetical protein